MKSGRSIPPELIAASTRAKQEAMAFDPIAILSQRANREEIDNIGKDEWVHSTPSNPAKREANATSAALCREIVSVRRWPTTRGTSQLAMAFRVSRRVMRLVERERGTIVSASLRSSRWSLIDRSTALSRNNSSCSKSFVTFIIYTTIGATTGTYTLMTAEKKRNC